MGLLDFLIPVAIAAGAFALAYVNPIITVVVAGLILLFANPLFSVIHYRLSEAEFEVTAFGRIRLRRVPYQEILQVRRVGWSELFKPEVRWAESLRMPSWQRWRPGYGPMAICMGLPPGPRPDKGGVDRGEGG